MNVRRIALAAVVAWIVSLAIGFFVNDYLFAGMIAANSSALRPQAALNANLPIGLGVLLIAFFALAYAYAKGYEGGSGIAEGVRFGVTIGIIVVGFGTVWMWVMFPINGTLGVATVIDSVVECAIYGAIIGAVYKPLAVRAPQRATV
jgi:hypothetical protein